MSEQEELANRTKQGILWFTALPFAMHFFRFANSIVLARILAPDDFAIVAIITILLYYSNSLTDFGLSSAIVNRKEVKRQHFGTMFVFNFVVSLGLFSIFYFTAPFISTFFAEPKLENAIKVYSILFVISSFLAIPITHLKRNVQFKSLAIIEAIKIFISIIISLSMATHGFGVWSMIIAMLVAQSFYTVLALVISAEKCSVECSMSAFKELFNFSLWSFISVQVNLISENIDKLIVGKILGTTALGLYDKANGLAKMPYEQISYRLSSVSFASFSRVKDDHQALKYYFTKLFTVNTLICIPVFFGLSAVSSEFTLVLLGEKWRGMIPVLHVLAISFLLSSITGLIASFNQASGKIKHQVLVRVFSSIAFILSLFIVAANGIVYVSFALCGFYLLLLICSFHLLNKTLKLSIYSLLTLLAPPLLSGGLMLLAIFVLKHYVTSLPLWQLFTLEIFVGVLIYSICVLTIPFSSWHFIRRKVWSKLGR